MEDAMTEFKTIRQVAAAGVLPEHRLRARVKEGRCPGIYSGSRFLINVQALTEQLERESMEAVCPEGKT